MRIEKRIDGTNNLFRISTAKIEFFYDVGESKKTFKKIRSELHKSLLFLDPLISEAIFVNYLVLFARYEPVNNLSGISKFTLYYLKQKRCFSSRKKPKRELFCGS